MELVQGRLGYFRKQLHIFVESNSPISLWLYLILAISLINQNALKFLGSLQTEYRISSFWHLASINRMPRLATYFQVVNVYLNA